MQTDGHTDRQMDRRTDMGNLIVAFCNFEKALETSYRTGHTYLTDLSCKYFCAQFTANICVYVYVCVCVCVSVNCSR
jgi:hypothetical protein